MKKKNQEGVSNFLWEDTSDQSRIQANTRKYQDVDIVDAFADYYKIKGLKKSKISIEAPPVFNIGEYVNLTVQGLDKKHIIFEQTNFKEEIQSTVNLAQYPRFKNLSEPVEITCRVVAKTDNKVLVDPIFWFYDQFIENYVKNTDYQYHVKERFEPFTAKNLKLVNGGFIGSLKMPEASEFFGKDIFLEVFIPGSQIVVNVEKNFDRWVGKDVPIYIVNYMEKPGSDTKIIVGSTKEYLKLNSRIELMYIFNHYCMDDDEWKDLQQIKLKGTVTGVVHTANKCGVFVEVGQQTGMIECEPEEIVKYKTGQIVPVHFNGFNELKKYNSMVDQYQHVEPYVIEDDILKKFNLKVTFKFADA